MDTNLRLDDDLLNLLRCPVALRDHSPEEARLSVEHDGYWLVCAASGYKYPVRDGFPQVLTSEGAKWQGTSIADLPVPPPEPSYEPSV